MKKTSTLKNLSFESTALANSTVSADQTEASEWDRLNEGAAEPYAQTLLNILNYSKSVSAKTARSIGPILLQNN